MRIFHVLPALNHVVVDYLLSAIKSIRPVLKRNAFCDNGKFS